MNPLTFEPYLRPMVWGGRKLEELFRRELPTAERYGESWEISGHPHWVSRVAEGKYEGAPLNELCQSHRNEIFGGRAQSYERFPLLIKLLDCHQLLSIQVHPNDELAAQILGDELGKTEAWIILDVEPEGIVYAGLKPEITKEELIRHLEWGSTDQCLHSFHPEVGDCLFLPAGTVHAVGRGVVMAEVQQCSDATFRLFDWNRVGPDGRGRPLHIEESLKAINFDAGPQAPLPERDPLVECPYFRLRRLREDFQPPLQEPAIYLVLSGEGTLEGAGYRRAFQRGSTVLVPASAPPLRWLLSPNSTILEITLPA